MMMWPLLLILLPLNLITSTEEGEYFSPRSCKELMQRYKTNKDGLYYLTSSTGTVYQTFCDMTTAGGGWTLVASVHENNLYGKCTTGDRWSSQQGSSSAVPGGDGSWSNTVTFGTAEAATSDDYKNVGYYDLMAENVAVWHVPNDERLDLWSEKAFLRYHTDTAFLNQYGGNLYQLYKRFPVTYNVESCPTGHGPSIPIVYDKGDAKSNHALYGPHVRVRSEAGFITFRAVNTERAATALCSGIKPKECNIEHACIGGGGFFPEGNPRQCGDFTSFDWDGYGTLQGWSASKQITEAAVLIFYR